MKVMKKFGRMTCVCVKAITDKIEEKHSIRFLRSRVKPFKANDKIRKSELKKRGKKLEKNNQRNTFFAIFFTENFTLF